MYFPTSIKDTMQWFPFLAIMEHTENILKPNKGLIPLLLKVLPVFQLILIYDKDEVEAIAIRCIDCKTETVLYSINSILEEMITKSVLNTILYHVGVSWIICSNKKMKYEIDKINHHGCLNKVPWYNTDICSKLHGIMFEYFITHARIDRYNLMCSIVFRDKKEPAYEDE